MFISSGRIGRTFRVEGFRPNEIQFDPDSLAFGENEDGEETTTGGRTDAGICRKHFMGIQKCLSDHY